MRYLAMDLDRTLIPNGPAPDDGSLKELKSVLDNENITPIFVTARRADSVSNAITLYNLPEPAYLIGQVGTTIHKRDGQRWIEEQQWIREVTAASPRWNRENLVATLSKFQELEPQPKKDSNSFKISYFLKDLSRFEQCIPLVTSVVSKASSKEAEVIASKDLNAHLAYVDILPKGVHKRAALDFLCNKLQISQKEILFAGDSENDLSIFLSPYKTIVVANAEESLKLLISKEKDEGNHFTASPTSTLNGNYASGIIQGLQFYKWV